ncbi:hypothetical protein SLA2020_216670 [Shorea laevis]
MEIIGTEIGITSRLDKGNSRLRKVATEELKEIEDIANEDRATDDKITPPFWEGLANENEILQSKIERLARGRRRRIKQLKQRKKSKRGGVTNHERTKVKKCF